MNEMENQFQRIVDALDIHDRPDDDYARQLRQQMLDTGRQTSSHNAPPGAVRPIWRKIMIRTAIAAMLLAGIFLAIYSVDESTSVRPDEIGLTKNTQHDTENTISEQSRQFHLAAQSFRAGDVQGLAGLLKTGSMETKLAVINYLKKLGTAEALKVLNDYRGQTSDPRIVSAIEAAVPSAKSSADMKETPATAEPNDVVKEKTDTGRTEHRINERGY